MAQCVTCGAELHPERAEKYDYCTSAECQEKNLKGLTMVAVAQNKAAEEFFILDDRTKEDLASGKYRDQRRGYFGALASPARGSSARQPSAPQVAPSPSQGSAKPRAVTGGTRKQPRTAPAAKRQWTASQERLARLYNEQGLRPGEIARKLGVSEYLATQIILAARRRGTA
jgi:hypothetical protein